MPAEDLSPRLLALALLSLNLTASGQTSGDVFLLFCSMADMWSAPVVCKKLEYNTLSKSTVQYSGIPRHRFFSSSHYNKKKKSSLKYNCSNISTLLLSRIKYT